MNRRTLLNGTAGVLRQPTTGALPLADVPDFVGAAAGQTPQSALRFGQLLAQQAQPAPPPLITDPADLVARALEILAEEDAAWQARRGLNRPARSIR
jgi:hypothetical protein